MNFWIELLGYAASLIVLISLTMKSLVKLRWINAAGSMLFVLFALFTGSIPTVFLNFGIVCIDLYFLYKLSHTHDVFEILPIKNDNEVILYFYSKYKKEIDTLFAPGSFDKAAEYAFYTRNTDIAGLVAYTMRNGQTAEILIDFVIPKYRDCAVGKHFFVTDVSFWKSKNIRFLEVLQPQKAHISYLHKMGFTQSSDSPFWKKEI